MPTTPPTTPQIPGTMSTFICEDQDGVTVAEVACEAVREHQAAVMRDQLRILAGRNGGRLAIGLGRVSSVSASFLCDLMWLRERCERLGGKLVLFGASKQVLARLESLGLCTRSSNSHHPTISLATTRPEAVTACREMRHTEQGIGHASSHRVLAWLRGGRAA